MISVILYGRNDAHGYNLHKRAAISMNCIAETLSAPGDEILFVDYNTPNDLPTFIEAIYDTLTARARSLLRVFRVRPELHNRLVRETHLFALEPHSRNIAIRRSDPRNRWVLFTNTDMIFVPRKGSSLSDAIRGLPDGQYILPRFELPEPLWESFPRSDPQAVLQACDELGGRLHLNEAAISHPYMRFDSPGDFQLAPRQAMFDIHGFDERMIHGWHADSNLCKRLYLFYGNRTESAADLLKGYHCDHTRVATLAHRLDIKLENDLGEFVYNVTDPVAPGQAATWGAPEETIEEVDFAGGPQARYVCAVERALGAPQQADYRSDANDLRNFVYYQPEHALPYLAGNLTVHPRDARFVYVGNNPRMLDLAARCIAGMGFTHPLSYWADLLRPGSGPDCATPIFSAELPPGGALPDFLLRNHDLLIFDFGLQPDAATPVNISRVTDWPRELRFSLGATARCLEQCAEACACFHAPRGAPPEFLVLNANHHIFRQLVAQFLIATETPYNTHVRKGRARTGEERLYRSHAWKYAEETLRAYFGYDEEDPSPPPIAVGQSIDLTSSGQAARYKDGDWGAIDFTGAWTDGPAATIVFSPANLPETDLLLYTHITEAFVGLDGEPIRVQVWFEDEPLQRWAAATRYAAAIHRTVLPARLTQGKSICRLTYRIDNPQSAQLQANLKGETLIGEDPRELGIKVQRITFAGTDRLQCAFGSTIDFTEKGCGVFHINECWTPPDNLGSWTLGPDASLLLFLADPVETPVRASFLITDAAVSEEYPNLNVSVAFNGRAIAEWTLGPSRLHERREILLPVEDLLGNERLEISFHVAAPRTPAQLKWSEGDHRPLGFRLTELRLDPVRSLKYKLGDVLDFTAGGNGVACLKSEWTEPDRYGSWTVGPEGILSLKFEEPIAGPVPASFVISDCMVSETVRELPVQVKANGRVLDEWRLGPDRIPHRRMVELPADIFAAGPELNLAFAIPTPRTPASLGWSSDSRPLGLRLARALVGHGELAVPAFDSLPVANEPLRTWARAAFRRLRAAVGGTA